MPPLSQMMMDTDRAGVLSAKISTVLPNFAQPRFMTVHIGRNSTAKRFGTAFALLCRMLFWQETEKGMTAGFRIMACKGPAAARTGFVTIPAAPANGFV